MTIDIRNVPEGTEKAINEIKKTFNYATNSEAVQTACKRYLSERRAVKQWSVRALAAERELEQLKTAWQMLQAALK